MKAMNFIAGEWQSTDQTFKRENPSKPDEIFAEYPSSGKEEAQAALEAAAKAFSGWKATPIIQRARIMQRAARILESRSDEVTRDLAREVGKIGRASCRERV